MPRNVTCRSRSVVSPNERFVRAYSSLPIRRIGDLQEPDDGRQDPLAGEVRPAEVAVDAAPDRGQGLPECRQPGELLRRRAGPASVAW